MLIDSPSAAAANRIPNIGVVENTVIVFIVPILFMPARKNKSAPPKPLAEIAIITSHNFGSICSSAVHFPVIAVRASITSPPASDFIIAILAGLMSENVVSFLLKLLSMAQKSIDARIIKFPELKARNAYEKLRSVVAMNSPIITRASAEKPTRPRGRSPKNNDDRTTVKSISPFERIAACEALVS